MNLGTDKNLEIMQKWCINGNCAKLQKAKTYEEKVSACSMCRDVITKYDAVCVIEYLSKEHEKGSSLKRYEKGKGLQLSNKEIERVLTLIDEGHTINQIKEQTGYSWRTISNIKHLTFKNEDNNARIKLIRLKLQTKDKL